LTATVIVADGVDADRVLTAAVARALVDVQAADEGVSSEALLALADLAAGTAGHALCIAATLALRHCYVQLTGRATLIWVATHALVAVSLVGDTVGAVAVGAAPGGADRREDRRHAQEVSVTNEAFAAETLAALAVAGGVESAGEGVAALPTLA
jgi:hypothetical protein